jgi:GR25 family glycosyltransferase involved in LPS biosynthesis
MEHIDVIFYINLENRKERMEHFLSEIPKLCVDPTKVVRIDAIQNKLGSLGCTQSHCKALEEFNANPEWTTCAIFEDDYTFRNADVESNNARLRTCFTAQPDWDCVILAYNPHPKGFVGIDTATQGIKRVKFTQTTSGYCVKKPFSTKLLKAFRQSASLQETFDPSKAARPPRAHCMDIYWNILTKDNAWYALVPALGYQYESFSDIEKRVTSYNC